MEKKLKDIVELFKKNNFDDLNNAPDEKKLLYLYSLYHYYSGDADNIIDVIEHCDYNKQFGNYIYGCFDEEIFDGKVVDILSAYMVNAGQVFEIKTVRFMLVQIQYVISQIKNKKFYLTANDSILKDYISSDSNEKICIKILTNYTPNYNEKNAIRMELEKIPTNEDYISFEVVFGDEILDEISQMTSDKKCVDFGELSIYGKDNNILYYGDENSIICNISAKSLKSNFLKYGKAGLFAMNLRFYIANKKVDAGIEESIKNKGENFWYYNNGIIIVCDDYFIENNKISLTNYSIVNGGQTTRMIGMIPFEKDFAVMCKIIKNKFKDDRVENARFVSEIAEASNTQKPINSRDIIANRPEQRLLKETLSKANIFVQIKRGDAAVANISDNYKEAWQKVKNEEIGQILYAAIYQKPGTARNGKDKIFSDKTKYRLIFGDYSEEKYSNEMIKDLLFIKVFYKKWANIIKKSRNYDAIKTGLANNGYLFTMASIYLCAKLYFSKDLVSFVKQQGDSEKANYSISHRIFNHRIFNFSYELAQKKLFDLFNVICDRYLTFGFNQAKLIKEALVYSDFMKTDKNYQIYIIKSIIDDFVNERTPRIFNEVFYRENENEMQKTKKIFYDELDNFEKIKNEEENSESNEKNIDKTYELIIDELKKYRAEESKKRSIKANDIFTNTEINNIAKFKPRSIEELINKNCFVKKPNTKTKLYGEDIIQLISLID